MTLTQLNYILTTAKIGSISTAAKELFISQPSLTAAIKELESELGITIFSRTNKGVTVSAEGEEFLGYARQVMEQTKLIEERYIGKSPVKHQFCVSTQHYSFAVEAFVKLLKEYDGDKYDFRIRETKTYEIIEDVAKIRSEIGVLYRNKFNESIINKTLRENGLSFHSLFIARPHVFVGTKNPLSRKKKIALSDLENFPRLSYEQGEHNSFYFSEEILSTMECKKDIMVSDRATLFNLLIGLNGYTICSGVINNELNGNGIVSIPLDVDDYMDIGYITNTKAVLSKFASSYISNLVDGCCTRS